MPPQVLAQYSAVNSLANSVATQPTTTYVTEPTYTTLPGGQRIQTGTQQVAQQGTELKPFQEYNGEFVAPVNAEQTSGIAGTNIAANEAQPYFGAATGVLGSAQENANSLNQVAASGTQASSAPLTGQQIDQYLSPYLNEVMGSTSALLGQQNEQAQAGQLGNAIRSGAFGGDRTGIAAANLNQQNELASANILSGIANQGYQSALSTAQGQQQLGLAGAGQLAQIGQTAYGEGANTASELGSLGTGAQSAGLQGSQAQIAAGTVQQQTQQAQDTAQYNQFLQQQSYPFQVAQFLANIAEGTGALSGSTTTTTQPGGFFSDERLKEDMEPIGKTFDGQPIYRYKMKGDPRERIGLSAQKVEKKHPEAVGLAGGFRYVDYGRATEEAANRGHFYEGGVVDIASRRKYANGGDAGESDYGLGAVLAAQRNMYANNGQPQQRNIAGPSASHQLAVAQGTPAPPPSGSSNVQQAVGLGQKGYQAYKYFTKPSTPAPKTPGISQNAAQAGLQPDTGPQPGVTTNFEEGPGTTTTFDAPAADTSGLGAANTAAPAADTAASGASEAASAGATEAAGAGATEAAGAGAAEGAVAAGATDAAVAGAADAAATEAAALAAEEAAAYAAAAAVAAKRGGRIRHKYESGGMPYSSNGDQLDIPDEQQSNAQLQKPGPLVKQPTGLQTAMKMGDMNNWSTMAGEMFSNQALAKGGVAGRRGYEDGGAPDDPDTSASTDTAPEVASDSDHGAGVAGGNKHWWQKSENIIPILSGLAAMGTAKTVHPGVALAAGLGAGAQQYQAIQQQDAEIARKQAITQGQTIENQMARAALDAIRKGLPATTIPRATSQQTNPNLSQDDTRSGIPANTGQPSDSATQTAEGLTAKYRHQFFVNTARTPEEQLQKKAAQQQDASIRLKFPSWGDTYSNQADVDYQARVQRDQQNAKNTAQQLADARYAQYKTATNPIEKQLALTHYNALRQWTDDGTTIEGGIVKNKRTNLPEIGEIAQQGLTPEQAAELQVKEASPVDTGAAARTPLSTWAATHGVSLPAPTAGASPQGGPVSPTVPRVPQRAPAANSPPSNVDFSAAPQAPPWANDPSVVVPAGQDPKAYADAQNALIAEAGNLKATQADVVKTQRMLALLPNAKTGPGTDTMSAVQTALGNMTGSQFVLWLDSNPSAHAILTKQLGQQALDDRLREMKSGGASVRLGAMQDNLILNKLSASPEMPKTAIASILNWQLQQDTYDMARQNAIPQYLAQGKDARYFDNIYPNARPLQKALTTTAPVGTTLAHSQAPKAISSKAEYDALPSGAVYIWPGRGPKVKP